MNKNPHAFYEVWLKQEEGELTPNDDLLLFLKIG